MMRNTQLAPVLERVILFLMRNSFSRHIACSLIFHLKRHMAFFSTVAVSDMDLPALVHGSEPVVFDPTRLVTHYGPTQPE